MRRLPGADCTCDTRVERLSVELAEAFVAVFSLGVRVEGWDGMSTRQWLEKIAALLALTRRSISAEWRSSKLQAISRAPSASSTR